MKKEKTIKTYQRKTKSGKMTTVKQHTAKYDSAEDMAKEAMKKKTGAGKELEKRKKEPSDVSIMRQLEGETLEGKSPMTTT